MAVPFVGARNTLDAAAPAPAAQGDDASALGLLAPLARGSRFARWTVARISPLERGSVTVTVHGDDGHEFRLEVLARDRSPLARNAPGTTERFAVYVANGGDGWVPTVEEQGLAAMTLATIIGRNEHAASLEGFLTHAERIARHRDDLLGEQA
jgi:hypothetical protein